MKKFLLALALIFAPALMAQQPNFFLLRQTIACSGACSATHNTYVLIIAQTGNPQVVAYEYTITATLVTGESRTISGTAERADNAVGNTSVPIDFGADIDQYSIIVQDLGIVSVRARSIAR